MKDKIRKILEEAAITCEDFGETTDKILLLLDVEGRSELLDFLTEISKSDQIYSNTRHKLLAKKLLKSNLFINEIPFTKNL